MYQKSHPNSNLSIRTQHPTHVPKSNTIARCVMKIQRTCHAYTKGFIQCQVQTPRGTKSNLRIRQPLSTHVPNIIAIGTFRSGGTAPERHIHTQKATCRVKLKHLRRIKTKPGQQATTTNPCTIIVATKRCVQVRRYSA